MSERNHVFVVSMILSFSIPVVIFVNEETKHSTNSYYDSASTYWKKDWSQVFLPKALVLPLCVWEEMAILERST